MLVRVNYVPPNQDTAGKTFRQNEEAFLVGYDNPYFSFDCCMENLFEDISGSMRHIRALSELEAA